MTSLDGCARREFLRSCFDEQAFSPQEVLGAEANAPQEDVCSASAGHSASIFFQQEPSGTPPSPYSRYISMFEADTSKSPSTTSIRVDFRARDDGIPASLIIRPQVLKFS